MWVDNASTGQDHNKQDRVPAQALPGTQRLVPISQGRSSTSQRVYHELKRQIMWGQIQPGTLLSEAELATHFGVSRTPVREALTVLASDGLITTLPWRGHLVRTVSFSEIVDAFRLRELLEVEAAAQACLRITQGELAHLNELSRRGDDDGVIPDINRQFHMTIARASGNRVLADFIERLLMMMQSVLIKDPHLASWTEDGMQAELEIIHALAARDEEAAREAMRSHIRNTLLAILSALEVS
jgi:DNA-binding GntR family transcriptional regulator